MCFFGGLGAFRELRFQPWRARGPPEGRKNCRKYGFRGTLDVYESFVRNTPCPEGWFCHENIVNNKVLARGHYRQFGAELAPKRSPKRGLRDRFGVQGPPGWLRKRGDGGSKGFRNTYGKTTGFRVRPGLAKSDGPLTGGGVTPRVLATFGPGAVFSSRRNPLPANLADVPPVRIVTFSDSSWGKSLQ